jgi:hypothetical protein
VNDPSDSRDKVWLAALQSALSRRAEAERLVGDRMSRLTEAEHLAERRAELLAEVESSASWRITAPLRWLKGKWQELRDKRGEGEETSDPAQVSGAGETVPAPSLPAGSPLLGSPWRGQDVPKEVLDVPSMITADERRLLYWLAQHYFTGEGAILDAGCYLGGSTLALATGLRDRSDDFPARPIFTYDLFRVDQGMTPDLPAGAGLKEGDSFRPLFEENVGESVRYCNVVEGNIVDHGWVGDGRIEIAFLDILKGANLNDFVVGTFFREFIPGRTVLVQQDFVHEFCPWIHVTMGYLDPYFELLDLFDFGSAVYLLREPIPAEALEISIEEIPPDEKIGLMDRAIAPLSGEMRGIVECAKACLLHHVAGPGAMSAHLQYVEDRYAASDQVLRSIHWTRSMYGLGGDAGQAPDTFHVPDPIELETRP